MDSGLPWAVNGRALRRLCLFSVLMLLLAPLFILVLAACSQDTPPPEPTIQTSPVIVTEEVTDTLASPIPTPVGEPPDPEPGTGHVTGRLVSDETGEPIVMATLFLGDILGEDGSLSGMGLEPDRAPSAETDGDGRFLFQSVPPGKYGLIWWRSHRESYVLSLEEQQDEDSLIVTVEEMEITDLGDIPVNQP